MAESASRKRKRPSAKEAKARMARAVASTSPISRAEEGPEAVGTPAGEEVAEDAGRGRTGHRGGPGGSSAGEEKLVRLSVDVPRAQHRFLRVEVAQAGATGMAVVRALISEMEADEDLAERVRGRLEGG